VGGCAYPNAIRVLIAMNATDNTNWDGSQPTGPAICVCREGGTSLVVVRSAQSALKRLQQSRDGHIQSLGDEDEILDRPTGPPSYPHRQRRLGHPQGLRQGLLFHVAAGHPGTDLSRDLERLLLHLSSCHEPRIAS
jgi:hypothetical protein